MTTKTRLQRILLVDDNPSDNFLHARVIRKVGCTEQVDVCETGMEALEYLATPQDGRYPTPELVFLDINMPGLSGWEFLEEYRKLPEEQRAGVIVTMLTSAPLGGPYDKSAQYPEVRDFTNKPLTAASLRELLATHFPDVTCG